MGFSRQEYWNGLPFPSPGDLPDLGTEPTSPALQADSLPSELLEGPVHSITIWLFKSNLSSSLIKLEFQDSFEHLEAPWTISSIRIALNPTHCASIPIQALGSSKTGFFIQRKRK